MIFVDTNYWIRYLTDQESKQGKIAQQLFLDAASDRLNLCSNSIVFFEIYWVLKHVYKINRVNLQKLLSNVLKMDFIEWEHKDTLFEAVNLMQHFGYDLEDSFNVCWAKKEQIEKLASFDRKLQKNWQSLVLNL